MKARQRLATLAWRNLWRNRRRTLITLFGISFGVMLAVVFTGMGDSTYGKMIDHAAKLGGGHVVVQHEGFQDLPSLKKSVRGVEAIEEAATADPRVVKVVPRITGATLLSTAKTSQGAIFTAIDPTREDDTTLAIVDTLVEGEMIEGPASKGVVLGRTLADTLGLELGKKMVYTLTDRHGEVVSGLARVKGIVETGAPTVDGSLCVLPIDAVRKVLGYEADEVTQVAVYLEDNRDAPDVAAALGPALPDDAVALTWGEASPDLAGYIAMERAGTWVFEGIIMVLLTAGIFNTLFVSVMERLREFGIMAAVGFSPGMLFRLVIWESLFLALSGLVAAAVITFLPYRYLNQQGIDFSAMMGEGTEVVGIAIDPIIYVAIYPQNVVLIGLAVVAATLMSGLYPAWRAGRTNPADVIRLQ